MSDAVKPKYKVKLRHLIWCGAIIGGGVILFFVLSAFGVFRYWQAEKIPQGKTNLRFEAVDLPFTHKADLENSLPFWPAPQLI